MKSKTIFFIKIFCYISIGIAVLSCTSDEECRKEKSVALTIAFKKNVLNQNTGKYTVSNLTIDSIWVRGLNSDSLIYNKKRNVQSIDLPLKKFSQPTGFSIRFNEITDTILIFHQTNENYFLSLECGCIAVHSIDEVISTHNYIDSISVINNDVNNTKATHIQIFN